MTLPGISATRYRVTARWRLAGVLLAAAGWVILGCDAPRDAEGVPTHGLEAEVDMWDAPSVEQTHRERVLREAPPLVPFLAEEPPEMEMTTILKRLDDDLFVYDYPARKLWRFERDGNFVGSYGLGPGTDPGQMLHIVDVAVRPETGEVYILDGYGNTISIFGPDGEYRRRVHLPEQYMRLRLLDSSIMVKTTRGALFHELDYEGTVVRRWGLLHEGGNPALLQAAGEMLPLPDGGTLYIPMQAGYLFYLSRDGSVERIVRTIDRVPFSFEDEEAGVVADEDRPAQLSVAGAGIDREAGEIYIRVDRADERDRWVDGFIDVYDLQTGSYLHSQLLPRLRVSATVVGGRLVMLLDDRLMAHTSN